MCIVPQNCPTPLPAAIDPASDLPLTSTMAISYVAPLFLIFNIFAIAIATTPASTPTPLLDQAGQQIAAFFGIEGGGSSSDAANSYRKLLDVQGVDATCTCGSRTYRRSGYCWCTCGRKLLEGEAATGLADDNNEADILVASSNSMPSRSLTGADAVDGATAAAAAQNCECVGRNTRYTYGGSGCNCWVSCSG